MWEHQLDLPATRLPIYVRTRTCTQSGEAGPATEQGPYVQKGLLPNGQRFCPPRGLLMTNALPVTEECRQARSIARQLRNAAIAACSELQRQQRAREQADHYRSIAWALFTAATAVTIALAAAGWVGAIVGAAIWIAIGLPLLILAISYESSYNRVRERLAAAHTAFTDAQARFSENAMRVQNACCDGDFYDDDVNLPSCGPG